MAGTDPSLDLVSEPDLMNDPLFDSNSRRKQKNVEDADTCRICRGEGSKEEPLFYPCKCSGSIKFVHQNCLMEWLSHSQKKHCELCKTPFRFTKLYHPHMPNSVPLLVFLRQAAVHSWKTLLAWSRLHLVVFVWVVWLPWCMRSVWRGLFWIADGGWINWEKTEERALLAARQHFDKLAAEGTTPVSDQLLMSQDSTASVLFNQMAKSLPRFLAPVSTLNLTRSEPPVVKLARSLIMGFINRHSNESVSLAAATLNTTRVSNVSQTSSSWLSNIKFLGPLASSPTFNNLLTDTLEGQLITLLVVIVFILVFLIREWVVQQQPGMNVGAAANADAAVAQVGDVPAREQAAGQRAEQVLRQVHAREMAAERGDQGAPVEDQDRRDALAIIAPARHRRLPANRDTENQHQPGGDFVPEYLDPRDTEPRSRRMSLAGPSNSPQRPRMPNRDKLAQAAEIRRTLEEQSRATGQQDWPGLNVFMDIWNRAESKPSEVLRIIEEEGLSDELGWIIAAMNRLENNSIIHGDQSTTSLAAESSSGDGDRLNLIEDGINGQSQFSLLDYDDQSQRGGSKANIPEELHLSLDSKSALSPDHEPVKKTVEEDPKFSSTSIRKNNESSNESALTRADLNFLLGPTDYGDKLDGAEHQASGQASPKAAFTSITENNESSNVPALTRADLDFLLGPTDYGDKLDGAEHQASGQASPKAAFTSITENNESSNGSALTRADLKFLPGPTDYGVEFNTAEHQASGQASELYNINPFHPDYSGNELQDPHRLQNTSGAANAPELAIDLPDQHESTVNTGHENNDQENENLVSGHPEAPIVNHGLADTIMNWLWGGINPVNHPPEDTAGLQELDDEHIVENLADEAPFVPVDHVQPMVGDIGNEEHPAQDPEVVAAAVQAGIDPNGAEAVDDGEDLEGIMELVGMQGPLAGLIQNGMFCAILVSLTISLGMWVPYIAGKLFLVFLANPISLLFKLPLRWASISADLIIDLCVFSAGCAFYWIDTVVRFFCAPVGWVIPPFWKISQNKILAETAMSFAEDAMGRLAKTFVTTGDSLYESDIPTFSIIAHESLRLIEHRFALSTQTICKSFTAVFSPFSTGTFSFGGIYQSLSNCIIGAAKRCSNLIVTRSLEYIILTPSLFKINPLRVSLNIPQRTSPLDFSLAYWDTKDRILAILSGYIFFAVIGLLYLRLSASLRGRNGSGKVDGALADVLYQAGGVMKVILIISIEMIAFPLYCGLLLDVALLPLFGNVTIMSRLNFLVAFPNTSLFVHWFVGTCYMFHFALFVSMCRRIMRTGVLYFIRDPDDPTFHPVRDVLERNVTTQLRKIAFSALVYGALVILCLGGVVWGIYFAFENIFPIHWSSNEPVLEFPVDLLFYNFLMPVAVKFFNPATGLNRIYNWWFRKCARALRISHFLFGKREEDEEGHHVRRTWSDWLSRKQGDIQKPVIGNDRRLLAEDRDTGVFFLRDGRYVLTPASDRVRIPKGVNTFVEVDEEGEMVDGLAGSDQGPSRSNTELFTKVYIPPFFRVRIGLFLLLIWFFAATTGIFITIIPLVVGRFVFANLIPSQGRMNDIYAFSIGLYLLGGAFYCLLHYRKFLISLRTSLFPTTDSNTAAFFRRTTAYTIRLLRLFYTYFSFAFILPSLFSLLLEFYIVIPLHTYFGSPFDRHIIHFIQDWTLGVLYVKMAGRLILWYAPSRPADALQGIVRHGWLNPDVRLATRSFIFPASLLMGVALLVPLSLGWAANKLLFKSAASTFQAQVYRYSYPAVLAFALWCVGVYLAGVAFRGWRQRIRDEVYLIGERLHNFGERRGVGVGLSGKRVARRG